MRVGYIIYKQDGTIVRSGHCSEGRVRFKARVGKLSGRKERDEKIMAAGNIDLLRIDATHKVVVIDNVPTVVEKKGPGSMS